MKFPSNPALAHAFAHDLHADCNLAASNTSAATTNADGSRDFYSYRTAIAKRLNNAPGNQKTTLLLSLAGWSPITQKHLRSLQAALHPQPVINCFRFDTAQNATHTQRQITNLFRQASTARLNAGQHQARALYLVQEHNRLCGVTFQTQHLIDETILNVDLTALKAQVKADNKAKDALKKLNQQQSNLGLALAEQRQVWRDGGRPTWRELSHSDYGTVMLRLKPSDQSTVETSMGASVPLPDALKLWPLIERAKRTGKACVPDNVKVGHFKLNTIHADGSIIVGCHEIPFEELEAIARLSYGDCLKVKL